MHLHAQYVETRIYILSTQSDIGEGIDFGDKHPSKKGQVPQTKFINLSQY